MDAPRDQALTTPSEDKAPMQHAERRRKSACAATRRVALASCLGLLLVACSSPGPVKPDAALAQAAEPEPAKKPVNPCEQEGDTRTPLVDDTRILLEETGCKTALWLDGLFTDEADIESARNTSGYLSTSASYSEFSGFDSKVRLRVRLELPSLKGRTSAFFGREDQEDFIRDRVERFSLSTQLPRIDDREEWLAGLGYALPGTERLKVDFRVGASGLSNPRVFVRSRLHYTFHADEVSMAYVRVTPFWRTRDGLGVTVGVDYSHVLSPKMLLRLSTVGTTTEADDGVDWTHSVTAYQNLSKGRGMAYQAFITGDTNEPEPLYEYGGRMTYRQPLVKDKLYGEFSVGYTWPRIDPLLPREGSYEVGAGLELPFGRDD